MAARIPSWDLSCRSSRRRTGTFVELCGGSAAVLLNKPKAEIEVLNDLADDVISFWRALREHPELLIDRINNSPPGEVEFKRNLALPPTDDDIEKARRFFVHISQVFSGIPTTSQHSFLGGVKLFRNRKRLNTIADRIRDVIIENTDAARLIIRVATSQKPLCRTPVLFYADPPYVEKMRTSMSEYIHDDFDHAKFLDAVLCAPDFCKFAISGYSNPLYDSRLADWHRVEFNVPLKARNNGERRDEVLWRNYSLNETARLF